MSKGPRIPLEQANMIASRLVKELRQDHSGRIEVLGSIRRGKPDVGDIDILVEVTDESDHGRLVKLDDVEVPVQVYYSKPESWGAFRLFLTGSGTFNIIMRCKAKRQGFKLNRYGLWDRNSNELVAGRTEAEIFAALGYRVVPPAKRTKSIKFGSYKLKAAA